jgi:hypothetical protein
MHNLPDARPSEWRSKDLTFVQALDAGILRNTFWKGTEDWTIADWGNAMAGECGECCNAIKKLRRIQLGMQNESDRPIREEQEARRKIRMEVIDTITYALHVWAVAARPGDDIGRDFKGVFNSVSDRYGFPVKL